MIDIKNLFKCFLAMLGTWLVFAAIVMFGVVCVIMSLVIPILAAIQWLFKTLDSDGLDEMERRMIWN